MKQKGSGYVANHLTVLRRKAGLKTVKEASKALEISAGMLYQIEENKKLPSVKLAIRLGELYKCCLDDIFLQINTTDSDNCVRDRERR